MMLTSSGLAKPTQLFKRNAVKIKLHELTYYTHMLAMHQASVL